MCLQLGNIEVKEDGSVSTEFYSRYLNLFGFQGIVGRAIVIHDKPLDLNTALNADVFAAPTDVVAQQNEEAAVGEAVSCGIISVMKVSPASTGTS